VANPALLTVATPVAVDDHTACDVKVLLLPLL
jgi:hypothetical protein